MVGSFRDYITNMDENVQSFVVRGEILERERDSQHSTKSMREKAFPKVKSCFVEIRWGNLKILLVFDVECFDLWNSEIFNVNFRLRFGLMNSLT